MWVSDFIIIRNLPLIASTLVFVAYSDWRRWLRGHRPQKEDRVLKPEFLGSQRTCPRYLRSCAEHYYLL